MWLKPALLTLCGDRSPGRQPRAHDSAGGEENKCLVKLFLPFTAPFAELRPGWCTPSPFISSALRRRRTGFMRLPPPSPSTLARACPVSPLDFSTYFSDQPDSLEVSAVAPSVDPSFAMSERGRSLVEGTKTLDNVFFRTKIGAHRASSRPYAAPAGPTLS